MLSACSTVQLLVLRSLHHEDRIFHIGYIENSIFTDPGYIEHTGVLLSIFSLLNDMLLGCSYKGVLLFHVLLAVSSSPRSSSPSISSSLSGSSLEDGVSSFHIVSSM